MNNRIGGTRIRLGNWLKAAGVAGAIALVYYSALTQLVLHDWAREDYSHCSLIPFVVLYFIWEKRAQLVSLPSEPSIAGFAPFLLGVCFYWLGVFGGEYYLIYFSLWLVSVGICWIHLGWKKVKTIGFSLIVMLFMFPFPNFINVRISLLLQVLSSQLGVWMLQLYGISAYREGNVIDLGFTVLQVVEACSGLRFLMPMMIVSLILAYWFRAPLWKKTVIFLSAIPVSVFMNSFRIAATGVFYDTFGPKVSEGFFHGFSGWLLFVIAVGVLLLEMRLLRSRVEEKNQGKAAAWMQRSTDAEKREGAFASSRFSAFTISILLLTAALSYGVEFREKVPVKRSFSEFPMRIGAWTGALQSMEQQFIDALHFSDYIMAKYRNPEGREIDFYIAYYESQRKGESVHSPETCLPGGGWSFEPAGLADISTGNGKVMSVNRSLLEKSGTRLLTYFWFPQRGRILTSLFQVKIYSFWDAITRQRTDGALVRLITPVYSSEGLEDAEKSLNGFAGEASGVLAEFLPS